MLTPPKLRTKSSSPISTAFSMSVRLRARNVPLTYDLRYLLYPDNFVKSLPASMNLKTAALFCGCV